MCSGLKPYISSNANHARSRNLKSESLIVSPSLAPLVNSSLNVSNDRSRDIDGPNKIDTRPGWPLLLLLLHGQGWQVKETILALCTRVRVVWQGIHVLMRVFIAYIWEPCCTGSYFHRSSGDSVTSLWWLFFQSLKLGGSRYHQQVVWWLYNLVFCPNKKQRSLPKMTRLRLGKRFI